MWHETLQPKPCNKLQFHCLATLYKIEVSFVTNSSPCMIFRFFTFCKRHMLLLVTVSIAIRILVNIGTDYDVLPENLKPPYSICFVENIWRSAGPRQYNQAAIPSMPSDRNITGKWVNIEILDPRNFVPKHQCQTGLQTHKIVRCKNLTLRLRQNIHICR